MKHIVLLTLLATVGLHAEDIYQRGFLSIEDAQASIQVPEGYKLELLLAEPHIEEPVDTNGDGTYDQHSVFIDNLEGGQPGKVASLLFD